MKETLTRRIRVYGIVQGVGFRPTVSRHATTCNIHGSVSNKRSLCRDFRTGARSTGG